MPPPPPAPPSAAVAVLVSIAPPPPPPPLPTQMASVICGEPEGLVHVPEVVKVCRLSAVPPLAEGQVWNDGFAVVPFDM